MAAGASGFFDLSGPDEFLNEAIAAVSQDRIWAPRETLALLAQRLEESDDEAPPPVEETKPVDVDGGELLILRGLRDGLSVKQIAAKLAVAELTVKARLELLYERFSVCSPHDLVAALLKQSLVV
jgi:DNA-binding NarL/FixJ family response regulator